MIDTHAHLDFESFDSDRDDVIARFFAKKGKAIVTIGCDEVCLEKLASALHKNKNIYTTSGFHPEDEGVSVEEVEERLGRLLEEESTVAVGEIGLDYFHNNKNKEFQKQLFLKQINVAVHRDFPVVVHCRDAYDDLIDLIKEGKLENHKMVVHCYGANKSQTEKFLQLPGVWFSFTGNITFPKKEDAEIFEVIKMIPVERVMVETDCPFLAPASNRGKRNEPAFVWDVIEKIAQIKGMSVQEIERVTDENACKFFNLKIG